MFCCLYQIFHIGIITKPFNFVQFWTWIYIIKHNECRFWYVLLPKRLKSKSILAWHKAWIGKCSPFSMFSKPNASARKWISYALQRKLHKTRRVIRFIWKKVAWLTAAWPPIYQTKYAWYSPSLTTPNALQRSSIPMYGIYIIISE